MLRFHGRVDDCLYFTGVPCKDIEYELQHDAKPGASVAPKMCFSFWCDDDYPKFKAKAPLVKKF